MSCEKIPGFFRNLYSGRISTTAPVSTRLLFRWQGSGASEVRHGPLKGKRMTDATKACLDGVDRRELGTLQKDQRP